MGKFIRMYSPQENVSYKQNVVEAYLQARRDTKLSLDTKDTTYGKNPL